MRPSDQHIGEGIRQRHTSQAREQLSFSQMGERWHSRKSRSFCPCQKLAREPPRSRDKPHKREGTPQPSKERKRTTKTHRDGRHRKERERTQKPGTDQPPGQQTPEPQHGTGRTPRTPSARRNGLKDGSRQTKRQPHEPTGLST